jgi:hypothetical protein
LAKCREIQHHLGSFFFVLLNGNEVFEYIADIKLEDINWSGAKTQFNKRFLDVWKHGTILETARGNYKKLYNHDVNLFS